MKPAKCLMALFILFVSMTIIGCTKTEQRGQALPLNTYERLKALITTKGTTMSTVEIVSSDGHNLSGTLIKNGETEIIVTAAHTFSLKRPDAQYQYVLDGRNYPIHSVYSHPKPGAFDGKDIAFCIPGKEQPVQHFWKADIDTTYRNIRLCTIRSFDVTLLKGFAKLPIKGAISDNDTDQLYIVDHHSQNGDSGSGLVGDGKFFVIKGNMPASSEDLSKLFGGDQHDLTLLTEL